MTYRTQNILSLVALVTVFAICGYDVLRGAGATEIAALQAPACCSRSAVE